MRLNVGDLLKHLFWIKINHLHQRQHIRVLALHSISILGVVHQEVESEAKRASTRDANARNTR